MKRIAMVILIISCVAVRNGIAQVPGVGLPVTLDLGVGGGVSLPIGTLSDNVNTGWHAGATARISGLIPINIVGSAYYNRLPFKVGSDASTAWMIGAGIEYPIPGIIVKPYLGLDGLVNVISSTASGAQSITREGLGIGCGLQFSVPAFGSFDASVKYQIFNMLGKESNEETLSQVTASVAVMFSVL
ncbi:MAG: hypothetical protein HY277_10015 [Ignavibacteriales bacterium]|nr:hypothetical protein [Ignavibacteriales bacterium]